MYRIAVIFFFPANEIYKEHYFIASLPQNGTVHLVKTNILVKKVCVCGEAGAVFPKFRSC